MAIETHRRPAGSSAGTGAAPTRLLVVDDQEDIRLPLAAVLERQGFDVRTAADGPQMRARLREGGGFDLVLLDVMLPGEDGLSLCRELQQRHALPVILLTALGETTHRVRGLEAGADDYVAKPFAPAELVARIRTVLRRAHRARDAAPAAPAEAPRPYRVRFDGWVFDLDRRELEHDDGRRIALSAAEHRLLSVFVAKPLTVLTRESLLESTGDGDADHFDRAIDSQVSRLRRKLEKEPRRPRLLKTAWGDGYFFASPVDALP